MPFRVIIMTFYVNFKYVIILTIYCHNLMTISTFYVVIMINKITYHLDYFLFLPFISRKILNYDVLNLNYDFK